MLAPGARSANAALQAASFARIFPRPPNAVTVLAADERVTEARCARDGVTARSRSWRLSRTRTTELPVGLNGDKICS